MRQDLDSKDYRTLLGLIELVYSIPDRVGLLNAVLSKLEKWIGITSAAFIPLDPVYGSFDPKGHLLYNSPKNLMSLFCSHYAPLHPFLYKGFHLSSLNEAIRLSDITSMSHLADTEWGRDFQPLTPIYYELGMMLGSQGDRVAGMCIHRKKNDRDFSARDKKIMDLLLPHLSHACQNLSVMEALLVCKDIGLIVMGSDERPLIMNDEARRALNGIPPCMVPDPGLSPQPTYFQTERGTYRVHTKMVRSGIKEKAIFLEPILSRNFLLAKLACFGLTSRQEEISLFVIWGLSNREIAEKLFITEQTVKDHLRDTFGTMKIRRRSELTAKVLGLR